MPKKSELLKELGWNDDLIRHFMVEDLDYEEGMKPQLITEVFDSRSLKVTFSADNAGTNYTVKMQAM